MAPKSYLLFSCLGNTCRSPMIEGAARQELPRIGFDRFEVESCGVLEVAREGHEVNPKSVKAMSDHGYDIQGHRSRFAGDLDLGKYFRIFVTGSKEREAIIELGADEDTVVLISPETNGIFNPWKERVEDQRQEDYSRCCEETLTWVRNDLPEELRKI